MWVATIVLLTLLTLWIKRFLTQTRLHPPVPPGPRGLPILGNLLSLNPELHSYFASLAQTHGPIYSLQLGRKFAVVISSPSLAKEVLRDQDFIFANHDVPAAARVTSYGGRDIVWTPYGPEWRLLRKVCVREMLCAPTLDTVYGIRRREVRRTIRYLWSRAGSAVNVGEQMFLTTMNVVMAMLWGGGGGGVAAEEEAEREARGREFRRVVAEMTMMFAAPNVSDFFPELARFDLQGIVRKVEGCAKRFDEIFEKVIDERRKKVGGGGGGGGEEREKDFLEVLLKMKDQYEEEEEEDGNSKVSFSMTHLKAILLDMVVGGTDTTSNTVEFAMAEVLNNPKILKKVRDELDTIVGKDNIVEEHHIHKLPYLQAVMKEALRLHPVLPLMVPHRPSESCVIGGYTIPKDTRVFVNVWAIHRDPSLWPNPLEFDPERFLNAKFDFSGNDFSYLPFGSGRRSCAGILMAERMVLFELASVLHSFDWELPEGEVKLDLEEKFGSVLSKRVSLTLIPQPRLSDPGLYE